MAQADVILILGAIVGLLTLAAAIVFWRFGSRQGGHLWMALFWSGWTVFLLMSPGFAFIRDPQFYTIYNSIQWVGLIVVLFTYPLFAGHLPAPWAPALRHPIFIGLMVGGAVVMLATLVYPPGMWIGKIHVFPGGVLQHENGPMGLAFNHAFSVAITIAFVTALTAWLRAEDSDTRLRMRHYVVAFGVLDLATLTVTYLTIFLPPLFAQSAGYFTAILTLLYLAVLWASFWTLHATFRHRIFGFDARMNQSAKTLSLAVLLGSAFFLATIVLESLIPEGEAIVTIAAATAIGLVLRPMQNTARKLADRFVPVIESDQPHETQAPAGSNLLQAILTVAAILLLGEAIEFLFVGHPRLMQVMAAALVAALLWPVERWLSSLQLRSAPSADSA